MIRIRFVLVLLILGSSACFKYISDQKCYRGKLTSTAKKLIDSYLKEANCKSLSSKETVIVFNFESNSEGRLLTINNDDIEQYTDTSRVLNANYKGFKIIVVGVPDDFIFQTTINKNRLRKELKKIQDANKKMYDEIEKGIYNKPVRIYSEYDPSMYYYIHYSGRKIVKTVPTYLFEYVKNQ